MRISTEWLNEYVATPPTPELEHLFEMAGIGVENHDDGVWSLEVTSNRGDWLSYQSADNARALAKVAWVNVRRTVVLLVRYPDRRALSLRMEELKTRLQEDRAFLVAKK